MRFCYAGTTNGDVIGEGAGMKDTRNAYDGTTISDPFALPEFVNWLRRSTRDVPCVLLSEDAQGKPYVPLDQVRATVGSRAVTVLLTNAVQQSARNQLDTVDPYHGATRIFPPGDQWRDDYRLVPCVMPSASKPEYLARIDDKLNAVLAAARRPAVAHAAKPTPVSRPTAVSAGKPAEEPSLADVRGSYRLFRIDLAHAPLCREAIMSSSREYPCILVSLASEDARPYLDVAALLDEIEDAAVVFVIADQQTEQWLCDHLPPWALAYHGACRFFPPRNGSDRTHSKLFYVRGREDSADVVAKLAEMVWNTAYADGYSVGTDDDDADDASPATAVAAHERHGELVGGVVEMIIDSTAYVRANDEPMPRKATIELPPTLPESISTDVLLRKGQHLHGYAVGEDGFEIVPDWIDAEDALCEYVPEAVVAGLVTYVCADMLKVMLYPTVEVEVRGADLFAGTAVNIDMDLRQVFSRETTIALRVVARDADDWLFTLPASTDTVVEPPNLLPEGPAWLNTADALAYLSRAYARTSLADVPIETLLESVDTLESASTTIRTMHRQLMETRGANVELTRVNERLRDEKAELVRRNRVYEKAIEENEPLAPFSGRFASIREELDWQLQAQSLLQFSVEERERHPLAPWSYGEKFFDSLAECEHGDMSRWALIRTMVLVLAGKETLNGLRQHQLRTGRGGDNPGRKDEQGNAIYRCNVHGQYRLHFSRDAAGRVMFLSVNTHDDLLL